MLIWDRWGSANSASDIFGCSKKERWTKARFEIVKVDKDSTAICAYTKRRWSKRFLRRKQFQFRNRNLIFLLSICWIWSNGLLRLMITIYVFLNDPYFWCVWWKFTMCCFLNWQLATKHHSLSSHLHARNPPPFWRHKQKLVLSP